MWILMRIYLDQMQASKKEKLQGSNKSQSRDMKITLQNN